MRKSFNKGYSQGSHFLFRSSVFFSSLFAWSYQRHQWISRFFEGQAEVVLCPPPGTISKFRQFLSGRVLLSNSFLPCLHYFRQLFFHSSPDLLSRLLKAQRHLLESFWFLPEPQKAIGCPYNNGAPQSPPTLGNRISKSPNFLWIIVRNPLKTEVDMRLPKSAVALHFDRPFSCAADLDR